MATVIIQRRTEETLLMREGNGGEEATGNLKEVQKQNKRNTQILKVKVTQILFIQHAFSIHLLRLAF